MNRRKFLKYSTAGSLLTSSLAFGKIPVLASGIDMANPGENILVIIQMFGGNDALNTIIPADNDLYYSSFRRTLNIPKNKALRLSNTTSYLHPALGYGTNDGLYGLFKQGNLAVIQGVGYPNPNLSHFRSTDIWLSGILPKNDAERLESGWLGRYIEGANLGSEHPKCMNIGKSSSLLFQTGSEDLSIGLENPKDFYEQGKDLLSGESFLSGESDYVTERNFLLDLSIQSNKYSKIVKDAFDAGKNTTSYSDTKLRNELKLVSRLISGGLKSKVYLLSIDGFDTHANQGTVDGKQAALLTEISEAVSAFMADLKAQNLSKKVLGMTVSEFGRRPNQNDSGGTDHGAAGAMFVFGEEVNPTVFGESFGFSNLDANKDFKYQFDFRSVYAEILYKWFGEEKSKGNAILKDSFDFLPGEVLRKKFSPGEILGKERSNESEIYPNPTPDGNVVVEMNLSKPALVSISFTNARGVNFNVVSEVPFVAGKQQFPMNLWGGSGLYLVTIRVGENINTHKIIWV
jgi:uncharacterized protein (DUF1501 family)